MMKLTTNTARICFFSFLVIFILITIKGLMTPQPGDENVYYYMGKLVADGKVPYRDFFFAHPPLQIYLIAMVSKLFGFNIVILKFIPLLSTLISGFIVYKIAEKKFDLPVAIISSLLFLFSYSIMFNSVFSFGVDIATTLLIAGIYFLWVRNAFVLSGLFFGLSSITRLLTIVPIAILLILIFFSNKRNFLKLLLGFCIVFLLVNFGFALLFKNSYMIPVYKFHFLKSFGGQENLKEYTDIAKLNWILFMSALLFVFVKDKKSLWMVASASAFYLIFLTTIKKIFGFYFVVIFPFLALIGGFSIVNFFKNYKLQANWKIMISNLLVLVFVWNLASDIVFLEKFGFRGFERGKDLIDFINLNSNKSSLLFGDDSVVPLLALMTDRKIALDFVDTNNEVFVTRIKNLEKTLADLKGQEVIFIIRSKQGISYFDSIREFLNKNCDLLSLFHDKIEGDYLVYRCK